MAKIIKNNQSTKTAPIKLKGGDLFHVVSDEFGLEYKGTYFVLNYKRDDIVNFSDGMRWANEEKTVRWLEGLLDRNRIRKLGRGEQIILEQE